MQLEPPKSGVIVRMYRTGFGDCFLLAFRGENGEPVYMLIDCGVHSQYGGGGAQIEKVVGHLKKSTDGRLAVIVVTHEHADHISGFAKCRDVFQEEMSVGEVWFAWTERPGDAAAADLKRKQALMLQGLRIAQQRFAASDSDTADRIKNLLGFFDGFGLTGAETMNLIRDLGKPRYLKPKGRPLSIPGVPGVRIFVLGPPVDREHLLSPNPTGEPGQVYTEMGLVSAMLGAADTGSSEAAASQPFAGNYRIMPDSVRALPRREEYKFFHEHYGFGENDPDKWRRIDSDWQYAAESLALKLDNATNNTSLVLAIELPKTKRVLLFPGDAQVGNWESWHQGGWSERNGLAEGERITAKDLLGRTVLYKVGHHGSHNATLREHGLEMMVSDELQALIPVDEDWAHNRLPKPWKMPFPSLYEDLEKRTAGRIHRTDRLGEGKLYVDVPIEDE